MGDVLSYAYLWHREAAAGQEEGLKDRPVVVVLATVKTGDTVQLFVAPITHNAPDQAADAIAMPANVKRDLGLDRECTDTADRNCGAFRKGIPVLK